MKILCSKSGIEFRCDHIPLYLTSGEVHHPIFNLPLPKLFRLYPKWQGKELTKTDSFLLFAALLNATELVEFRCHIYQRPNTDQIVASNMTALFQTIGNIMTIKNPRFAVPRFVISKETRDLENVRYWIEAWQSAYQDFLDGMRQYDIRTKLQKKAEGLEKLIKNPSLNPARYAHFLAAWAAEAGQFPTFDIRLPDGTDISLSEYWQEIIIKCHTETEIISIPRKDLDELLEHCEENLDAGSIQAHQVFTTLKTGKQVHEGFFGLGSPTFTILNDGDSVEQSNLTLLLQSAPVEPPKRIDYPSEFKFIQAKMKYRLWLESQAELQLGEVK